MKNHGNILSLLRTVLAVVMMMTLSLPAMGCGDGDGGLTEKPLPPEPPGPGDPGDPGDPDDPTILKIVDPSATAETKALLANLWRMQNWKKR